MEIGVEYNEITLWFHFAFIGNIWECWNLFILYVSQLLFLSPEVSETLIVAGNFYPCSRTPAYT